MENSTTIVLFLQRLNETALSKRIYFVITLFVFYFTILVNLTLMMTIVLERALHEPMFIFLCNLCINGIFSASAFYPKLMVYLSSNLSVTSYEACLSQIFVLSVYTCCEFNMLAMMAYDRYVAICKPLSYHSIITPQKVMKLLLVIWLLSISESAGGTILIARLPLCGFNIEKIYCTGWEVIKLSCVDTTINNIYGTILSTFHVLQIVLILLSYVNIIKVSVRSQEDRNKFMQTCLPHLLSLINFTVSFMFDIMYARYGPTKHLYALRNFMSMVYLIFPPVLNPLIYGLKMNQIRQRMFRICSQKHALK